MKHNLTLLVADIRDELARIRRLLESFRAREELLSKPAEEVPFYDRAAMGYYLHNFYNGCENIFKSVARFFENDLSPDSWHADLLKRMKLEVPGYRPAVIDEDLYRLLDDFRAFRHVYRNVYTFELDWERERLVGTRPRRREGSSGKLRAFWINSRGSSPSPEPFRPLKNTDPRCPIMPSWKRGLLLTQPSTTGGPRFKGRASAPRRCSSFSVRVTPLKISSPSTPRLLEKTSSPVCAMLRNSRRIISPWKRSREGISA